VVGIAIRKLARMEKGRTTIALERSANP